MPHQQVIMALQKTVKETLHDFCVFVDVILEAVRNQRLRGVDPVLRVRDQVLQSQWASTCVCVRLMQCC